MTLVNAAVKSADRVLDLFELLADSGREMSHSEIADTLRIPRSSLTQLLKNLLARGYVSVNDTGRGYLLGERLLTLSQIAGGVRELEARVEPFLTELTRLTGESSALNRIKGDSSEVTATILGPARLVTHMRAGDLAPLYATSGGKAILANMPKEFQDQYLARVRFESATPATLKSAAALKKQLATARSAGFAYSHEEWTPGIIGVAAPVLDTAGYPIGAINVAIPAARFDSRVQGKAERALQRVTEDLRRHCILPTKSTL